MSQIEIFKNSEFGEIRITIIDGEPWFVGKDVALALGYKDTVNALKTHVDKEDKAGWQITTQFGEKEAVIINESGLYSLTLSSKLADAKKFKHWITHEVLPSIRKTGSYSVQEYKKEVSIQDGLLWIDGISKGLNLNESSKLKLYKDFGEPLGLPTPDYVNSKGVLHSATELLKKNHINISARIFNQTAIIFGVLKEIERKSHNGIKKYKNLTEKGLLYGENQVNPQNPRETQPMYYDDKFLQLCKEIGIKCHE